VLSATLTEFNAAAAAGRDDRFGRRAAYMAPLDLADLYAIELWPAAATTSGGPRRNARAQVVRPDGTPVPGQHAAQSPLGVACRSPEMSVQGSRLELRIERSI
jgi:predicted oxidoreductase